MYALPFFVVCFVLLRLCCERIEAHLDLLHGGPEASSVELFDVRFHLVAFSGADDGFAFGVNLHH